MKRWFVRALSVLALAGLLFMAIPPASASADQCNRGEIYCMPDAKVQLTTSDPCAPQAASNLFGLFNGNTCTTATGLTNSTVAAVSPNNYIPGISDVFVKLTQFAQTDAFAMLNFVLTTQLSGNNVAESPVLVCQQAQGAQRTACAGKAEWFIGQYALMRDVGFYVVVPLFFIMVIQSIARGNIFNLLRSSLIMLPLSIIGTVALISIMQLLLNIADDFCNYIVGRATVGLAVGTCNVNGQLVSSAACGFTGSLAERSFGNTNLFVAFVIYIMLFAASVSIYLELVGRELGIYVMALVMPLAMAAIVWPRAAAIARQLIQWELAATFAKIFMVAAVSLGLSAFANTNSTSCTNTVANGQVTAATACGPSGAHAPTQVDAASNDGITTSLQGLLIVCLASFAFMKSVVTLTPAAVTGQKPIWDKGAIRARGQAVAAVQQRTVQFMKFVNKNRKPGTDFKSKGHNPNAGPRDPNDPNAPLNRGPDGNLRRSDGTGHNSGAGTPNPPDPNGGGPNGGGPNGPNPNGGGPNGGHHRAPSPPTVIDQDGNELGGSRGPGVDPNPGPEPARAVGAPVVIDMGEDGEVLGATGIDPTENEIREQQQQAAQSEEASRQQSAQNEQATQQRAAQNDPRSDRQQRADAAADRWSARADKMEHWSNEIQGKSRDSLLGKFANDWAEATSAMKRRQKPPSQLIYQGPSYSRMEEKAISDAQLQSVNPGSRAA